MAAFQLLGAYQRYHYSIEDLEKRSFLADNNWLGEVARREKQGQASAITSHNGYEQYVAYCGTNSTFFLGFQYLKMYGDVLEFDVIGKAIGAYQKVLSKNFRKLNLAKPKKMFQKNNPTNQQKETHSNLKILQKRWII